MVISLCFIDCTRCASLPGYVASSFSSLRSLCLISGVISAAGVEAPESGFLEAAAEASPGASCVLSFVGSFLADRASELLSPEPLDWAEDFSSVESLSKGGFGVLDRLGSSLSSITKAASKTAGSGLGAASATSEDCFLARDLLAGEASPLRDEVEADRDSEEDSGF